MTVSPGNTGTLLSGLSDIFRLSATFTGLSGWFRWVTVMLLPALSVKPPAEEMCGATASTCDGATTGALAVCEIPDVSARRRKASSGQNRTTLRRFMLRMGIFRPQNVGKQSLAREIRALRLFVAREVT